MKDTITKPFRYFFGDYKARDSYEPILLAWLLAGICLLVLEALLIVGFIIHAILK